MPFAVAGLVDDSLSLSTYGVTPSNGMLNVLRYVERLQCGVVNAETTIERLDDFGALEILDGHDGLGQVIHRPA
jgi:LDH2 family malate/lactate/ureidoglycolate dehydrogenase